MDVVLAGSGAAIAAGVASYLVAKRTNSGSIDTSDAAVLWAESQSMRKELRNEVVSLRTELGGVKQDLIKANKEVEISHDKISKLISKVKQLERHVKQLGGKI